MKALILNCTLKPSPATSSTEALANVVIGELKKGAILVEAKEESANASVLKYQPIAISGQKVVIEPKSNLVVDAWVFAVTTGHALPSCIRKSLTGVVNY